MALEIIITSQTATDTSDAFYVSPDKDVNISCTPNLASGETAVVQISSDEEGVFADYEDGAAVKLDSSENAIRLAGPAWYKIVKSVTAGATAIHLLR